MKKNMEKTELTKIRVFFSVKKEERFLNSMGARGYQLEKLYPFVYCFRLTDEKATYSIEWLDSSPETEENQDYIASKCKTDDQNENENENENGSEKERIYYCGKKNCCVYFRRAGKMPIEKSQEAVRAISKRYFSLSVFWSVVSALFAGLTAYNFVWVKKFDELGYVVKDDVNEIMRCFKFVVGKNPAKLMLWLVIPLTCAALAVTAVCWLTYMSNPRVKRTRINKKAETDSEKEGENEEPQL